VKGPSCRREKAGGEVEQVEEQVSEPDEELEEEHGRD
jgi:hypothetical protein